jgi:cytoskeletal protein CcmA (bactofilin family)
MFGKKKRRSDVIQTLVGEGSRIEGDLRFEGGCHIDGIVHGGVVADRDSEAFLSISEDGRVEGSVKVPRMALNGTVEGDVFCTERVQLGPTARVVGNLHYELIEMAAGAEINGQLIHQAGASASARTEKPGTDATQPMATVMVKNES